MGTSASIGLSRTRKEIMRKLLEGGGVCKDKMGKIFIDLDLVYGKLDKHVLYPLIHLIVSDVVDRNVHFDFVFSRMGDGDIVGIRAKDMLVSFGIEVPFVRQRVGEKRFDLGEKGKVSPGSHSLVVVDEVKTGNTLFEIIKHERERGFKVEHAFCMFSYGRKDMEDRLHTRKVTLHAAITLPSLITFAVDSGFDRYFQQAD